MSDGLTILFAASLFGQQSFDGFPEEVGAVLAFVAFCFDEQCSSCSFIIDEGSLTRVVVVEFDCTAAALGADDATRRDVFNSRSFGLPEAAGAKYSEVSMIHTEHGWDTFLHAPFILSGSLIWCVAVCFLFACFRSHPPILTKSLVLVLTQKSLSTAQTTKLSSPILPYP